MAGSEYKITQDLLSCQLCQLEPEFHKQVEEWNRTVEKHTHDTRELVCTVKPVLAHKHDTRELVCTVKPVLAHTHYTREL